MNRILIADDCKELLYAMKFFLESKGYDVETISKTKTIFKTIAKFKPHLLITDVFMEGKDGLELCKEVRSNPDTKNLRIIIFSSSPKALEDYKEFGADDRIEKPFELFELERKIQTTLKNPADLSIIKGISKEEPKPFYKVS